MELGNMLFGNSRGPIPVDRELVDSKEWVHLAHVLLQTEDYHCSIDKKYYFDYIDMESKIRTNNLIANEQGGYTCICNGKVIFEIFPYYWGNCSCGIEEENEKLESKWRNELFTQGEWEIYMTFEEWCNSNCPACDWLEENKGKTKEELKKLCTCKSYEKNEKNKEDKNKIKDKIEEYERREREEYLSHNSNCLLLKHNFIYHPNQEDEFWIDWYKYPFRDAYMNKNISNEQIKGIWEECSNILEKVILENGGTWNSN